MEASEAEWAEYLYLRANTMGPQVEWWYHQAGCGLWFLAERDRALNEVVRTFIWEDGVQEKERERGGWMEGGASAARERVARVTARCW